MKFLDIIEILVCIKKFVKGHPISAIRSSLLMRYHGEFRDIFIFVLLSSTHSSDTWLNQITPTVYLPFRLQYWQCLYHQPKTWLGIFDILLHTNWNISSLRTEITLQKGSAVLPPDIPVPFLTKLYKSREGHAPLFCGLWVCVEKQNGRI